MSVEVHADCERCDTHVAKLSSQCTPREIPTFFGQNTNLRDAMSKSCLPSPTSVALDTATWEGEIKALHDFFLGHQNVSSLRMIEEGFCWSEFENKRLVHAGITYYAA